MTKIKVAYDTNRVGPFTKTVTITSNASEATKTIKITGKVITETEAADNSHDCRKFCRFKFDCQ